MKIYNNICLTPLKVIIGAYIFLAIFMTIMFQMNMYHENDYFTWGPPLVIFKKHISSTSEFYILLVLFFINKMINTTITEIVYTWIVNCIQDPKSNNTFYPKNIALMIVLMNSAHLSINSMFTVNGASSQVSFLLVDILGNLLVIYYTNKRFIERIDNQNRDALL